MPEYRRDSIVDRWVIIAPERAVRPLEFSNVPRVARRLPCPFCEGNESETTRETAAVRTAGSSADGPGWRVRIVANLYPALQTPSAGTNANAATPSEFDAARRPAVGRHEVVVETPNHTVAVEEISADHWRTVWRLVRERFRSLRDLGECRYVQYFKNVGQAAGASLEHAHAQLMALDVVPPTVEAELTAARDFFDRRGACIFCDLAERELAAGVRVVEVADAAAAFCPFASRFSSEVWVVPRRHVGCFSETTDAGLDGAVDLLHRTLRRLERSSPNSAYNVVLHTAPFDSLAGQYYHWHWEILPRETTAAGFEWGAGIHVNPVAPEAAAECLRRINPG